MSAGFTTFAEVISFAVIREEDSCAFYSDLAAKTDDPFMRQIFNEFAEEESRHKQLLESLDIKAMSRLFDNLTKKIDDMGISENTPPVSSGTGMPIRDALILAMKREEKSQNLYSLLAQSTSDNDLSLLFAGLAREEAGHRLRIEKTYQKLFAGKSPA
jgi:rubrerythrin